MFPALLVGVVLGVGCGVFGGTLTAADAGLRAVLHVFAGLVLGCGAGSAIAVYFVAWLAPSTIAGLAAALAVAITVAVRHWPPNTDNRERLQSWMEGLRLAVEAIMAKYRPLPAPTFNEHDPVSQREFIDNTAESLYRILGQMVQFPVITDKGRADIDRIHAQLAEKRAQKRPQLHEAPVRLDYSRDVIAAAQAATGVVREQVGTTELCTQMGPEWVQRYSRHQDLFISMVTAMIILVPGL